MKKLFILILTTLLQASVASAQTYTVATDTITYSQLVDDIVISDSGWVGQYYPILLPFPVKISNLTLNQLYVGTDGGLARKLNSGGYIYYDYLLSAMGNCALRQKVGDTSHISFVTEGTTPNRIVKIQFRNAGFVGDETQSDKINFQLWLYESGKKYELIYGPQLLHPLRAMNGAYGPAPCIGSQYLRGNANTPQIGAADYGLSTIPSNRRVYRFTRP